MKTILLGVNTWDLVLDISGNIAVADVPYALAQDVASMERTFLGECYYNTTIGVDYRTFLGRAPNVPLMKAKMVGQALQVPEVVGAKVFITGVADRRVTGQVQVTDENGDITAAAF